MKKIFTLIALLAMVVSGAWAAGNEPNTQILSQDFQNASTVSANWTSGNGMAFGRALKGNAGTDYYYALSFGNSGNAASWAEYTLPNYSKDDDYKLSFLAGMYSCSSNKRNSLFKIVGTSGDLATTGNVAGSSSSVTVTAGTTSTSLDIDKYSTGNRDNLYRTTKLYKFIVEGNSTDGVYLTILSADGNTSHLAKTRIGDYQQVSKLRFESGQYYGQCGVDDITLSVYRANDSCEDPTYLITAPNGTSRKFQLFCDTQGSTIYYSTTEKTTSDEGWTEYTGEATTDASTVWIYAKKGSANSEVVSFETGAGSAITLNKPVVNISAFIKNGNVYNPSYAFSSNQSDLLGKPSATLSYSIGGETVEGNNVTITEPCTLTVTASADGYTSNSTEIVIPCASFDKTFSYNFSTFTEHSETTVGNTQTINNVGCQAYSLAPDAVDWLTINMNLMWKITANEAYGLVARTGAGSVTYNGYFPENSIFSYKDFNGTIYTVNNKTANLAMYGQMGTMDIYVPHATSVPVTISDAGYATFVAPYNVDFTGNAIEAFAVSAINANTVTLKKVTTVPAGEAVIVMGATGTVNVVASAEDITNLMVAATQDIAFDADAANINYVLANGANGVGLYPVTSGTIVAGKGYLPVPKNSANSKGFEFVEDNATDAGVVEATPVAVKNGKYTENGQIVIFINGKKYNVAGMNK